MSSTAGASVFVSGKFTRWLRWASGAMVVALALAGCGGGGETPTAAGPALAAPADVVGLAQAQQSVDQRLALPRAVALAAVSAGTASEDFESGMADWSNWGNARVVAGAGTAGSSAMQVGTGAGGAGLTIAGIVPGTPYRLTAQVRLDDPAEPLSIWGGTGPILGINWFDSSGNRVYPGTESRQRGPGTPGAWATVTIDVAAPANAAVAVVWVWKNASSSYGYVDDVVFGPAAAAPPPPPGPAPGNMIPNGGFEDGMPGWSNWGNAQVVAGAGTAGSNALQVGTGAGGAGLNVPGVVPGTAYRLTAQVRVTNPSEPIRMGVNFFDASGNQLIGYNGPAVTGTAYGTLDFDVVAPANSTFAVVWVWKNAGTGYGYVDDLAFGPAGNPPPPSPAAGNLVVNGGFENALSSWVDWGNSTISTSQAAAGTAAAQVGTGAGGFGQDVGGVAGGQSYRLSAFAKVSTAGETGYLGVRFTDDAGTRLLEQSVPFTSTVYARPQLTVAAPANATRALVYVWKNAGSGFAYVDEIELAPALQTVALTSTREQVNPVESGRTYNSPDMARLANGGYVIVWNASPPADGIGFRDTCFHRYDANGASSAPASCVVGAHAAASIPRVAARPEGGFTILWNEGDSSSDPAGFRWQDYDAGGTPQGAIQSGPLPIRLTAQPLAGGGYVRLLPIADQNDRLGFQLYAADGTPIGQPQPVFDAGAGPGIAVGLPGGGFAVAWRQGTAGGGLSLTRAFSADGTPQGEPVEIAPNTLGPVVCSRDGSSCPPWQSLGGIAATPDGGYIVSWVDGTGISSPGGGFARQFRADGSPASNVVGKIGDRVGGRIVAVGPDAFVMATEQSDAGGTSTIGISALHVDATPLH